MTKTIWAANELRQGGVGSSVKCLNIVRGVQVEGTAPVSEFNNDGTEAIAEFEDSIGFRCQTGFARGSHSCAGGQEV